MSAGSPGALRLLHLSDPHFGTEVPAVTEALLALAHDWAPSAIVVSGDLTQRATPPQFAAAAAWLARLPRVPCHVLPGNHDLPWWPLHERWRAPRARVLALPGGWSGGVVDHPGLRLIGVDTTRWWRHQLGTLSPHQIEATSQALRQAPPGSWRVVVTHHPLAVRHARDHADRPWRHAQALSAWLTAGVDTLLSGHLHDPAWWEGSQGVLLAQAGTALSRRLPPGTTQSVQGLVQHVDASGWPVRRVLQRWDYLAGTRRFELSDERAWSVAAGR